MKRRYTIAALVTASVALVCAGALGATTSDMRSTAVHRLVFGPTGWKGASANPIKVGLSISETGPFAATGEYQLKGYKLFVSQLNQRGGWLGRPVQLVVYDDQSNPGTAVLLYEKLISQDHVDLLVGPYSSGITQAALAVPEKHHMVMLDPGAAATDIYRGVQWNFQAIERADRYLLPIADICKARNWKTVGLFVNSTSPFTVAAANAFKRRAARDHLKVAFEQRYPGTTSDFSSTVLGAKSAGADCILGATNTPDAIGLVREINRQGLKPKLLAETIGPVEKTFLTSLGSLVNGVIGTTQWWASLRTPGNRKFLVAYEKAYAGQLPDYHSALGYSAFQVLEAAIKKVRSLDQTKLRDTIRQLRVTTVAGIFKVDANGLQTGFKTYLMQWQGSNAWLVYPPNVAQRKIRLPYSR
jgi:branched-chain amino acid transport system substrate-binding protein